MFFLQYISDLHNNVAIVPQGSILGPMFFLQDINDLHDYMIYDIASDADNTILYSKCDYASDLSQQLKLVLNLNLTCRTLDWGRKCLVNFNSRKTQLVSFDGFNNVSAIDMKVDWCFLNKKSSFNILGLSFTSKLDLGFYIASVFKTALKKFGALIFSMKFLFPELALYPNKFTIQSRMEYFCHV